jgi:hypothetical protein
MLAIKGIEPKDQVEAMLAAQMAAVQRSMSRVTDRLIALVDQPLRGAEVSQGRRYTS